MKNIQVPSPMTRFMVLLLIFCGTLMFTNGAHQIRLEDKQWRDFLEANGLSPDKVAARNTIPGAPVGIKSFIGWKNHWKFQRCPPGMKRDNQGMCRVVWV
jgi:hypothetical protein